MKNVSSICCAATFAVANGRAPSTCAYTSATPIVRACSHSTHQRQRTNHIARTNTSMNCHRRVHYCGRFVIRFESVLRNLFPHTYTHTQVVGRERSMYGVLCGRLSCVLPMCVSFADRLWAYSVSALAHRRAQYMRAVHEKR